jgi:hypothetical protein
MSSPNSTQTVLGSVRYLGFWNHRTEGVSVVRRQGRDGIASEMPVQFGVEHAFESELQQGAGQSVEVAEGQNHDLDQLAELEAGSFR